jgi:hypothetical protein
VPVSGAERIASVPWLRRQSAHEARALMAVTAARGRYLGAVIQRTGRSVKAVRSRTGARRDALRAAMRGIGHLPADRHEFTLPVGQSCRPDIRLHHRAVRPVDRCSRDAGHEPTRIAADLVRSATNTASLQRMRPGAAALAPGPRGIRSGGSEVAAYVVGKG